MKLWSEPPRLRITAWLLFAAYVTFAPPDGHAGWLLAAFAALEARAGLVEYRRRKDAA